MNPVIETMDRTHLVTVLRGIPAESLTNVLDALYDGGIRLTEITYDSLGAVSDEETARRIALAIKHTEGRMLIGAGTVITKRQLELTESVGGRFIISPNTDPAIISDTKRRGLVSIPGAMTVSEIVTAMQAGADYVKLFPVHNLGVEFVRHVMSPLNNAKLLAVAGVTPEKMKSYLDAGCVGFGVGSAIANRRLCEEGRFDLIRENARRYAEAALGKVEA